MLIFVLAMILAGVAVAALLYERKHPSQTSYNWSAAFCVQLWCWVAAGCLIVGCVVGSGIIIGIDLDARKQANLLPAKEAQRDALIDTVRAELSNDEYAELVGITDPNAYVVFAQGTAVSDYLIARGGQIVALNAEVFRLRNELAETRQDVCNALDNPFIPRLPFVTPSCNPSVTP